MPDLMIDFITSLDGYAAAEGWPGLWGLGGPEYLAWLDEPDQQDHITLMGATTYRLMAGFANATTAPEAKAFDYLSRMPKVVFSSTLEEPLAWRNTELIRGDAVEAVSAIKLSADRPLRTLGSLSLCRALLRAGLVDRFRVVIFPVITGATGSDPVYAGYPDVRLDLITSRLFDGRLQLLEYAPTVLAPDDPRP